MNRLRASAVAAIAAAVAAGSVSAATLAPASAQTAGTETGQQQVAGTPGTTKDNPVVLTGLGIVAGQKVNIDIDAAIQAASEYDLSEFEIVVNDMPAGLSFDTKTHVVTGTAPAAGTYVVTGMVWSEPKYLQFTVDPAAGATTSTSAKATTSATSSAAPTSTPATSTPAAGGTGSLNTDSLSGVLGSLGGGLGSLGSLGGSLGGQSTSAAPTSATTSATSSTKATTSATSSSAVPTSATTSATTSTKATTSATSSSAVPTSSAAADAGSLGSLGIKDTTPPDWNAIGPKVLGAAINLGLGFALPAAIAAALGPLAGGLPAPVASALHAILPNFFK